VGAGAYMSVGPRLGQHLLLWELMALHGAYLPAAAAMILCLTLCEWACQWELFPAATCVKAAGTQLAWKAGVVTVSRLAPNGLVVGSADQHSLLSAHLDSRINWMRAHHCSFLVVAFVRIGCQQRGTAFVLNYLLAPLALFEDALQSVRRYA